MNIQFQFNSSHWVFENGYIKCDSQIYVEGKVFFNVPNLNVVELAIQLGKWLEAVRHGHMRNFVYDAIDHDEPLLNFSVHENGVQLYSNWQEFEVKDLVPLAMITSAITRYIVALNGKLHAINYIVKLDQYLNDNTSENAKALMYFEQNECDEAFSLFKKLAEEHRDVQSLTNLAWMYLHEEEDLMTAKCFLDEVLTLNNAYFPFNMLGEIALTQGDLQQAETYLTNSLQIERSEEAVHNLAIVNFKQNRFEEAARYFGEIAGDSNLIHLNEVVAWIKAGQCQKAKALRTDWNREAEDFVGATEVADVYIQLGEFELAKQWFELDRNDGYLTLYVISRYAYTLMQLGEVEHCQQIIDDNIAFKSKEIQEAREEACDEDWTELDKQERIEELQAEKKNFQQLFKQLQQHVVPAFDYELYPTSSCYLFGCQQHGHAEYGG